MHNNITTKQEQEHCGGSSKHHKKINQNQNQMREKDMSRGQVYNKQEEQVEDTVGQYECPDGQREQGLCQLGCLPLTTSYGLAQQHLSVSPGATRTPPHEDLHSEILQRPHPALLGQEEERPGDQGPCSSALYLQHTSAALFRHALSPPEPPRLAGVCEKAV